MANNIPRIYKQILEASLSALETLLESYGWTVLLHRAPEFVSHYAKLPLVIVAPPEDLGEVLKLERFDLGWLGFEVFVGNFVDDRAQDRDQLWKRTDVREVIRLALWEPIALGLGSIGEFDVDYDPKGAGGKAPPDNVLGSWQKFTFWVETVRAT